MVANIYAKQYFSKISAECPVDISRISNLPLLGFADFLQDFDHKHRDSKELMRKIAIFCYIYFTRGVDKVLRRVRGG